VTTVIGGSLGWNKDVLVRWANRQGLAGVDTQSRLKQAGGVGDVVHDLIEKYVHQPPSDESRVVNVGDGGEAATAFSAFLAWNRQTRGEIIATELFGVDEEYQTGWCLDALRFEDPGISLVDWKTSGGTYGEHLIQVAAYTVFVEQRLTEWRPDRLGYEDPVLLTGAHVCRFDKTTGGFSHKFWPRPALDVGWRAFTWLRALHEVRREIESRVR